MSKGCTWALAALSFIGLTPLGACDSGEDSPTVQGLEIHIYGPSGTSDPFVGVGWIRITASGDGLATPYTKTVPYSAGGSGSIEGIPFSEPGQKRDILVEGWSDAGGQPGFVVSRGRVNGLEVPLNGQVQELDILFARVNGGVASRGGRIDARVGRRRGGGCGFGGFRLCFAWGFSLGRIK
jgi:hypothetical protein